MTPTTFWTKVRKSDRGCWIWTGATTGASGYGKVTYPRLNGRGKQTSAHRMSYVIAFGEIPGDLFVCHKCDNPLCVRPDHLFLGSASDNTQDAIAKGRFRPKGKCGTRDEARMRRGLPPITEKGLDILYRKFTGQHQNSY